MAIRLTKLIHTCRCEEISPPTSKAYPMKIPVWLKPGVWGVVIGGIATAVIGFSQLGWTTSGKAELLAQERASTAVVAALVPFCIAKAQQDPDKAIFAKFQAETSSYSRSDMVIKAGGQLWEVKHPPTTLWRVLVRRSSPAPRPADCTSITVPAVAFEEKVFRHTLVDPRLFRNA